MRLDLARTSVFLDFDGTITVGDIGVRLLERFGADGWREIDDAFVRGQIESRECLIDEWALVSERDREVMLAVAREVPTDPGFQALVEALRGAGAEVSVVSDGFGFYVAERCEPLGLRVITNAVDWSTGDLEFPHEDRCCPCTSCGVCKQAPIKDAAHRGRSTVLVGDGASDRKAAMIADVVFAKGDLAAYCDAAGVAYRPFATLSDVRAALFEEGS